VHRLVNASSGALPANRLIPVKRSGKEFNWLLFLNPQNKADLEHKFDHERVQEIEELYSESALNRSTFRAWWKPSKQVSGALPAGCCSPMKKRIQRSNTSGATVQITGETEAASSKPSNHLIATPGATPVQPTRFPHPRLLRRLCRVITPQGGELEGSQTPGARENSDGANLIAPDTSEKSGDGNDTNLPGPNSAPRTWRFQFE